MLQPQRTSANPKIIQTFSNAASTGTYLKQRASDPFSQRQSRNLRVCLVTTFSYKIKFVRST